MWLLVTCFATACARSVYAPVLLTGRGAAPVAVVRHAEPSSACLPERLRSLSSDLIEPPGTKVLSRWRATSRHTIRVRIDDAPALETWSHADRGRVPDGLQRWQRAGVPLSFEIVAPGADADMTVCWVDRFDAAYGGWTSVERDAFGAIRRATIALALRDAAGRVLSPAARDAIVVHELGHALGLRHATDSAAVMWPVVRDSGVVTTADAAMVRRLYTELVKGAPRH
jgi:hypothetical protein